VLLAMLFRDAALLGQGAALRGKLLQGDHLGLVGFQEPAVGTVQPVQSRPQLTVGGLLAEVRRRALGQETLEALFGIRGAERQE
jgi:hypothetical protein